MSDSALRCSRRRLSHVAAILGTAVATALGTAVPAAATSITVSDAPQPTPTFDGGVYATALTGDTIYVGGAFTHALVGGKRFRRDRLAAIDARTGALLPWTPSANATVTALATDGYTVYAAGTFTTVNGQPRPALAALASQTGQLGDFTHTVSGAVDALSIGDGHVYAGGRFTGVDSHPEANLAAFSLATGALDAAVTISTDDRINALLSAGGRLYLGGLFRKVNGTKATKLAAVNPLTGALDATFHPKVAVKVLAIAAGPAGVYAALGGTGGTAAGFALDGTARWTATTDGDVQAVAYLDGVAYLGGHFDNACLTNATPVGGRCVNGSLPRVKLAAVDAGTGAVLAWNPTANGVRGVFTLSADADSGMLVAGGEFTTLGGIRWPRFAEFSY